VDRFLDDKFPDVTSRKIRNLDRKQPASLLLLIEALLVAALGFYMVALGFTHDKAWMPYLSVIGFAFVGSAALYALSKGVKEGKRWANSPAILANLIALGVAKYQFEAGLYWLAIPIATMAVTVVISIFLNIKNSNK
jgi:hypothetical protein